MSIQGKQHEKKQSNFDEKLNMYDYNFYMNIGPFPLLLLQNISLKDQPKELQTFLQVHFMYLSEAKTITSDMAYELDPLLFDHLLKYLLFELCHLDDGEPKDLPNQSTCLSQDLNTFLSQIKYIAERLYCNLHNMIELKECQKVGGDLVNVC